MYFDSLSMKEKEVLTKIIKKIMNQSLMIKSNSEI